MRQANQTQAKRRTDRKNASRRSLLESLEQRRMMYHTYVGDGDGADAVWSFHDLSYSYSNLLDGTFYNAGDSLTLRAAVQEAMGVWSSVSNMRFHEEVDSGPYPDNDDDDYDPIGHPTIRWGHHPFPDDDDDDTLAHGFRPGDDGTSGDILYNDEMGFTPNLFKYTAAHELGHALGMKHASGDVDDDGNPPYSNAIMYAVAVESRFNGPETAYLDIDDAAGIRSLYGQGLGYVLTNGELNIYGTNQNDTMTVDVTNGVLTATRNSAVFGYGAFSRSILGVQRIVVHGMDGGDDIRIENDDSQALISVVGGGGDDTCDVQPAGGNLDRDTGLITFDGGDGTDRVNIYDFANVDPDTYTIDGTAVSRPNYGNTRFGLVYDQDDVEGVKLVTGSAANTVLVKMTTANAPVTLDSQGGTDTVRVIPLAGLYSIPQNIYINNSPSYTRVVLDNSGDFQGTDAVVENNGTLGSYHKTDLIGGTIYWRNADTSKVDLITGRGVDLLKVKSSPKPVSITNGGPDGADFITLGGDTYGSQGLTGAVSILSLNVSLTVDDSDDNVGRRVTVNDVGNNQTVTSLVPGGITFPGGIRALAIELGNGNDRFDNNARLLSDFYVGGGNGNDDIELHQFQNWYLDTFNVVHYYVASVGGGYGDHDTLLIDDLSGPTADYQLLNSRITSVHNEIGLANDRHMQLDYAAFDVMTVWASDQVNHFDITDTVLAAAAQTNLFTAGGSDTVTIHPTDADGNARINAPIDLYGSGGVDTLTIDGSNSTVGTHVAVDDGPLSYMQYVTVAGGAPIGTASDLENVTLIGSQGPDTIDVNAYRIGTALAVVGGAGNDTLNFGGPDKNVVASITSIRAFVYDGGDDTDDFNFLNDNATDAFNYSRGVDYYDVSRVGGGYALHLQLPNVENFGGTSGAAADNFVLVAAAPGALNVFDGGAGDDHVQIGVNGNLDPVQGQVQVIDNGGDAGDVIVVDGAGQAGDRRVHVGDGLVGAIGGDNLFGAGGFLRFAGIAGGLQLLLGDGNDTIFAKPDALTPLLIDAGGAPAAGAGDAPNASADNDTLIFAFAAATNPVDSNGDGGPSGVWTFDDRAPITYANAENRSVDDAAPYVVASSFDVDGPAQQLAIVFSEYVAPTVGLYSLELVNVTTGETISPDQLAMTYDANVATYTFPGFAGGTLPDGVYAARVVGGANDEAGNAMGDVDLAGFHVLAGDADRDGTVGFADLLVLAQNFGQSGQSFSQGDFNYDGVVDFDDLLMVAQNYGRTFGDQRIA